MLDAEYITRLKQLEQEIAQERKERKALEKRVENQDETIDILLGYCRALKASQRGVSTGNESRVPTAPPQKPIRKDCSLCGNSGHLIRDGAAVRCECFIQYEEDMRVYEIQNNLFIKHAASEQRRKEKDLKKLEKANDSAKNDSGGS